MTLGPREPCETERRRHAPRETAAPVTDMRAATAELERLREGELKTIAWCCCTGA